MAVLYNQQIREEQILIRDIEAKTKVLEENITRQRKSMGG
jgi:hypothetical protein